MRRIFGCCDNPNCPYCHGSGIYETNDAPAEDAPIEEWLEFLRQPPKEQANAEMEERTRQNRT